MGRDVSPVPEPRTARMSGYVAAAVAFVAAFVLIFGQAMVRGFG